MAGKSRSSASRGPWRSCAVWRGWRRPPRRLDVAFLAGLLHPVLTPSHALALFGLGLLIGQHPAERRLLPQTVFALALAAALLALAFAVGETPAGILLW